MQNNSEKQHTMEQQKHLTVKEWSDEDRPREKLIALGKKQLSNAELIAILLRTGVTGRSAVDLAKDILASADNSLTNLARLDFKQLSKRKGMALAKSATLMAALELGWRMQGELVDNNDLIVNDSISLFNYVAPLMADIDHEEFWAIYLNNRNKVIDRQRISSGGQTETTVDLRLIFRGALECKAVSLMVAHNHPSGSLRPSREDRSLTQQITDAGKLLNIKLKDHLIVGINNMGKADFYSFHDDGQI